MSDEVQPIIIKRKKAGHAGGHGGAWKVAFADFMTAMMAFFLVMWLVGQKPEVREAVAGYFKDPGKYQQMGKAGVLKGSSSPISQKGEAMQVLNISKDNQNSASNEQEKKTLKLAAEKIIEELQKQPIFDRLKKNVKIQMSSEGLRIILNESEDSPAFFEPGSSKLLQKSAVILITIAHELGTLSNHIALEGHTDANYSGRSGYSNWELSSDRANAARELMSVSGLSENQVVEVRGYADTFPMITDNPNDQRNRRVTIMVLYKGKERQLDHLELGADLLEESRG